MNMISVKIPQAWLISSTGYTLLGCIHVIHDNSSQLDMNMMGLNRVSNILMIFFFWKKKKKRKKILRHILCIFLFFFLCDQLVLVKPQCNFAPEYQSYTMPLKFEHHNLTMTSFIPYWILKNYASFTIKFNYPNRKSLLTTFKT